HQGDVELGLRAALLEQLARAADAGVAAAKDHRAGPRHDQRARRSAARAAPRPHIPWTPPPGGVAAEQRYTPWSAVRYGFQRTVGRNTIWRSVAAPALMSPPT